MTFVAKTNRASQITTVKAGVETTLGGAAPQVVLVKGTAAKRIAVVNDAARFLTVSPLVVGTLQGPAGPTGATGPQGPAGSGGNSTDAKQAVQNFAAGQVAQATSSSTYDLASAASINNAAALGVATAAVTAGSAVTISTGFVTVTDWTVATGATSLTPKATYYLSATAAGNMTTTAPSASGQCVTKIGVAVNPQTMLVEIEKPYLIN
jgi:hypothetical protein